MARAPKTIRLPNQLEKELEQEFARRGIKEWSSGVVDLLNEAVRTRRVPGICFVDSVTGRRPASRLRWPALAVPWDWIASACMNVAEGAGMKMATNEREWEMFDYRDTSGWN